MLSDTILAYTRPGLHFQAHGLTTLGLWFYVETDGHYSVLAGQELVVTPLPLKSGIIVTFH